MNLLVITREFPPYVLGGLSYHLGHLYSSIEQQGHDITVLAGKCSGYNYEVETLVPDDADVFRVPFGSFRGHEVRFPLALRLFLRDFDISEFDVALAHTELPFSLDIPLITKYHDCRREMRQFYTGMAKPLEIIDRAVDPIRQWVERRSLHVSDCAIFNSNLCERTWAEYYTIPTRTQVIHNGVDDSIFYPRTVERSGEYVLFVGDEERKGLSKVLAFAESSPHPVRVVGPDSLDSPNVTALGRVDPDTLARFYSGAMATVHPAKFEAFGNVVLESLACGTPVVTTEQCGASEILDDSCGVITEDIASGVAHCARLSTDDCVDTANQHRWSAVARETVDIARDVADF